jgi:hypothetical protein
MERVLENLSRLTCFVDRCNDSADPVVEFSISHLLKIGTPQVIVIATDRHPSIFKRYVHAQQNKTQFICVDCFSDPFGWIPVSENIGDMKQCLMDSSDDFQDVSGAIQNHHQKLSVPGHRSVVFFDSISSFLLLGGLQATLRLLAAFLKVDGIDLILVLHEDIHDVKTKEILCDMARVVISVLPSDPSGLNSLCRLDLLKKRSNGSVSFKVCASETPLPPFIATVRSCFASCLLGSTGSNLLTRPLVRIPTFFLSAARRVVGFCCKFGEQ